MFGVCGVGLVVRWMTDLGRAGGPYIRLTLLWTRSTITILSKASKALHHPPPRKTIIRAAVVRGSSPITGAQQGGIPLPPHGWTDGSRCCGLHSRRLMSTSNGLLPSPPHRATCGLHARFPRDRLHQVQLGTTRVTWSPTIYLTLFLAGVVHERYTANAARYPDNVAAPESFQLR